MFQSTPPYKRATGTDFTREPVLKVSIHAPVQAGDGFLILLDSSISGFNPRPRTSGRLDVPMLSKYITAFQSTPPYKRATVKSDSRRS